MKAKIEDTQIQDRVVNLLENKHQNKIKQKYYILTWSQFSFQSCTIDLQIRMLNFS